MAFDGLLPRGNSLLHLRRTGALQPRNIQRTAFVVAQHTAVKLIIDIIYNSMGWDNPKIFMSLRGAMTAFTLNMVEEETQPSRPATTRDDVTIPSRKTLKLPSNLPARAGHSSAVSGDHDATVPARPVRRKR